MISRRNFLTMTILMAVLLFLCMCLNNLKDHWNDYAVNTYTETAENYPSKVNIYMPGSRTDQEQAGEETGTEEETVTARRLVTFIGREESILMEVVRTWAAYTKRDLTAWESLALYRGEDSVLEKTEMLVVDSTCVDWDSAREVEWLFACMEQGVHLVFCNLPDVSVIQENEKVRSLFGIRKVVSEETAVEGLHLCEGFLLGGETIYEEKENSQDMETVFPWYVLGAGTKAYMKAIPEEASQNTNTYPALIWRKSFGTAYVFAVNGGYMEGAAGLGLLSAMSAEMYSYEIYPVVNAQNIVLAGYPGLADENREEMDQVYSRSVKQVFQEIVWPGVSNVLRKYGYRASCMMTPQFDYEDGQEPDKEQLVYYLKLFKEERAEVGLSFQNRSGTPVAQKLREDGAFFQDALGGYTFTSFYGGNMSDEEVEEALQADTISSARTVVTDYEDGQVEVVGFLSEYVTAQSTFGNIMDNTHRNDFLVKCLETSLGYYSAAFDMTRVAYPEEKGDAWEKLSRSLSTMVAVYGEAFPGFERTTVSECDIRIRNFLALDYQDSRTGDRIDLQVTKGEGPVWFLLRTHNEQIRELEGADYREMERDVYLIEVQEENVSITLEPADERHYR